jgi:hypothetical protein
MKNAYKVLVGIPHEKEPLGRTRCRCEDNIKIELGEIGLEDVNLANLFQDREPITGEHCNASSCFIKGEKYLH